MLSFKKFKIGRKNAKGTASDKTELNIDENPVNCETYQKAVAVVLVREVCNLEKSMIAKGEHQTVPSSHFEMVLVHRGSDHTEQETYVCGEMSNEAVVVKSESGASNDNELRLSADEVSTEETLEMISLLDSVCSESSDSFLSEDSSFDSYDDNSTNFLPVPSEGDEHIISVCCTPHEPEEFHRELFVLRKHASGKLSPSWTREELFT